MQQPHITDLPPDTHVQGLWIVLTIMVAALLLAAMVGFVVGWWWRGRYRPGSDAAAHPTAT
jgi:hypothetical protein